MECDELDIDKIADKAEVFVTALPHGISKEVIPKLVEKGKRIVDHSGDFRYKSVEVYEKWYNATHGMPHLLKLSAYGLPELHREEIKKCTDNRQSRLLSDLFDTGAGSVSQKQTC